MSGCNGEVEDGSAASNAPRPSDGLLPISELELPTTRETSWGSAGQSIHPTVDCISSSNNSKTAPPPAHISRGVKFNAATRASEEFETLDFSDLELVCPINASEISNRWSNAYMPFPGQMIKEYPARITKLIFRILKSYAAVAVHGRGIPPFVHSSQIVASSTNAPLSTCLSLVRVCDKPLPGSEVVVGDVLQREMNTIYDLHTTYDDLALLAAFQAYLIYTMVLFFLLSQDSNTFLRQAMMNLQELGSASAQRGVMCSAEQQLTRPKWEAWMVSEAKRRSLFTMYLFDSVLSAHDGLPTFLGTELRGLPAPAGKLLWQAKYRQDWETAYNIHLAEWSEGGLRIDELWPIPADLKESEVIDRRSRIDHWLEDVDEYGTMLYAVTSCTHDG